MIHSKKSRLSVSESYKRVDMVGSNSSRVEFVPKKSVKAFEHLLSRISEYHGSQAKALIACGLKDKGLASKMRRSKRLTADQGRAILDEYNRIQS